MMIILCKNQPIFKKQKMVKWDEMNGKVFDLIVDCTQMNGSVQEQRPINNE